MHLLRRLLTILLLTLSCSQLSAQGGSGLPKPRAVVYDRRGMIIDSLISTLDIIRIQQDSMRRLLRQQTTKMEELTAENFKIKEENTNLKSELEDARGDNLQSSHTNSVLFIFNVAVGIFLLIALIWMFMRKKGDDRSESGGGNTSPRKKVVEENFENKLERIQKLGNLRDKGLLTDEEFNLQKKQILGE